MKKTVLCIPFEVNKEMSNNKTWNPVDISRSIQGPFELHRLDLHQAQSPCSGVSPFRLERVKMSRQLQKHTKNNKEAREQNASTQTKKNQKNANANIMTFNKAENNLNS